MRLLIILAVVAVRLCAQYSPPSGGGSGSLPVGASNCVVASPANGSSGTVACRALAVADIPLPLQLGDGTTYGFQPDVLGIDTTLTPALSATAIQTYGLSSAVTFAPTFPGYAWNGSAYREIAAPNRTFFPDAFGITDFVQILGTDATHWGDIVQENGYVDFYGTGSALKVAGIQGQVYIETTGTPVGKVAGMSSFLFINSPADVTNAYGIVVDGNPAGVNAYGIHIEPVQGITNGYGIDIADVIGAVNNWSIKTGLGKVEFGDIVQAAGYKSSDGTAGATVSACTSFKNGLCVAGT